MHTHVTNDLVGVIKVDLLEGTKPFAVIDFGAIKIFAESVEDADQLIRAGTLAKELLTVAAQRDGEAAYVSPYGAPADEVARDAEPYPPPKAAQMAEFAEVVTEARDAAEAAEEPLIFEPDCDQQCDVKHHRGFVCTRRTRHNGDHAAIYSSGDLLYRWPVASHLAPPAPYTTGDLAVPTEDDAR